MTKVIDYVEVDGVRVPRLRMTVPLGKYKKQQLPEPVMPDIETLKRVCVIEVN